MDLWQRRLGRNDDRRSTNRCLDPGVGARVAQFDRIGSAIHPCEAEVSLRSARPALWQLYPADQYAANNRPQFSGAARHWRSLNQHAFTACWDGKADGEGWSIFLSTIREMHEVGERAAWRPSQAHHR